jgi:hypothetical protein
MKLKSEFRNPKSQGNRSSQRAAPQYAVRHALRISRFGFLSDFGFRISDFLLLSSILLVAVTTSHAASTNDIPPLLPPRGEILPSLWEQHGVLVVVAGILMAGLLGLAIWLLARPKPPVIIAPALLARQELDGLRQKPQDGALLSRVSQVFRHYVNAAFGLPPAELTTTEFCRLMESQDRVGPQLAGEMGSFLRECDQRKFAPPSQMPPFSAVSQAAELISQTESRLAALAQPAPPAGQALAPPILAPPSPPPANPVPPPIPGGKP